MDFKICVVGCGAIANAMHGPSYLKYAGINKDAVFAACCDIDGEKAGAFAKRFGFKTAYTDMDEMISAEKPDALCLISSEHMTAILAAKALEAGLPLLLEKPPGRTGEETQRLIEIAERKNVPNRVAFNRRYSPLIRTLKDMLNASPAPIQSLQYDMYRVNRTDADFAATAIHAIDAVRFISGSDYKGIRFTYREYPEIGSHVADIHMSCEMKNGTPVNLNICPVTGINVERAVVNLYDNTYFLDHVGNELYPAGRLVKAERHKIVFSLDGDKTADGAMPFEREGFYYENASFFDCIIEGKKPAGDLVSALQSVEAADCIRNRLAVYNQ